MPGIQLYVDAPDDVSVTLLPTQMDALEADAVTDGEIFTVMVRVAVPVQPFAAVPVTVYVVVVVGDTVTGDPVRLPGIHPYVDAPVPVRVVELPEQIVAPLVVVPTVGEVFTAIICVTVELHPVLVPVTVYVVVVVGETVTDVPLKLPGIQLYVVAPFALSVAELPEQMVVLVAVTVTVGV